MTYTFDINPEALKRRFSIYVVVAQGDGETLLYVGKTGDNREGCNPLISRCGNHFSYNKIHSQVRNKIEAHENWRYTYVFDHFDEYCDDLAERRERIDRINEMERWLNLEMQGIIVNQTGARLLNPLASRGYCSSAEKQKRSSFRTLEAKRKVHSIVAKVVRILQGCAKKPMRATCDDARA
ncbi:MAG: hypothetical protein C4535_19940 [Comamonadaceae bacterium]|nr:MAG: hypothetical protein C4535_19940 [Comamonadaceae bacterium]